MKILVVTEQRQGKWNNASFETLVAAQQIASATSETVSAVIIGKGVAELAEEIAGKNVADVLLVEHELLENYTPDGYCVALKQVIEAAKPDLVLFPHTYQVRDLPRNLPRSWAREWSATASDSGTRAASWFSFDKCFRARPWRT